MTGGGRIAAALAAGLLAGAVAGPACADDSVWPWLVQEPPRLAGLATRPTLNFYGVTGLIDMPSAESQPDGTASVTVANFGAITRTTLSFQLTPRLSGSFRYTATRDWDRAVASPFTTFYDRSFDIRYQLMTERRWLPAVTVGLQDFAGTGLLSGEYIVATKHITPRLKLTAGLGWGRLGSFGGLGAPFGARPAVNVTTGGQVNTNQWFRGPAAPFAGIEWQPTDRLGLKLEYSSDDYTLEAQQRRVFDRRSPVSAGVEYQLNDAVRLGAYYLYGSEFGITAAVSLHPEKPPLKGGREPAPVPVKRRAARAEDPAAWSPAWAANPAMGTALTEVMAKLLEAEGLRLEALALTGSAAELRFRNPRYGAEAQAIGRAARLMTQVMPASVETFRLVPVVNGMPVSAVVLRRSDLEALEHDPDGTAQMLALAGITDVRGALPAGAVRPEGVFPDFSWGIGPHARFGLFDPDDPLRADFGVKLKARAELLPGLVLEGALAKRLVGNLEDSTRPPASRLPRVRTDLVQYDKQGDPALEQLTLAYFFRPGADLYGRVSGGYFERMYGGVSAEVLWKPVSSRLALGLEVNYAKQREFDILLGFRDYDIVTGHASAYYDLGRGYLAQIDAGRYLAGDWGATIALDRTFANGWSVGAFATFTDVSAADFGEGSFDKGIRVRIPLAWFTGQPSRMTLGTTIRPVQRDGGARLSVPDRLYGQVRDYHRQGITEQWGRFWR